MKNQLKIIFFILGLFYSIISFGIYETYVPIKVKQPNGKELDIYFSGDEFYTWLHDDKGYTIVPNKKTRYYCYAILENDSLIASKYIVGKDSPETTGLLPNINISSEKMTSIINQQLTKTNEDQNITKTINTKSTTTTDILNNLVIYVRFADDTEFPADQAIFTSAFNGTTGNAMRNYFREVSYNQLDISSTFYPTNNGTNIISYQDYHYRSYYQPIALSPDSGYTSDKLVRQNALVQRAINYVESQISNANLILDYNNDGYVDNVCLILKGETSGEILKSQKWSLRYSGCNIDGVPVDSYNIHCEERIKSSSSGFRVNYICHEMFHSLGIGSYKPKDLYHPGHENIPVGPWDLMGYPPNPPVHMSAYTKSSHLNWITIPEITSSGTYTLNPITSSTNNCYKISISGSSQQYFVLEYRRKTGTFESSIPNSGLLVYRVDELQISNGNYWGIGPGGLIDDEVFIFRKDGTPTTEGNISYANLSSNVNRTEFNNNSNPFCFIGPSPGYLGNVYITNITDAGSTISFDIRFCDGDDVVYSNTSSLPELSNASNSISTSGTVVVQNSDDVTFEAGNGIILNGGFEVQLGGTFEAKIGECGNP